MTYGPDNSKAAFLSTYEVFPTDDENQLQVKMSNLHTDIANCVNIREIGLYEQNTELLTGQQYSYPGTNQTKNYVFRKVFYFGAIAPGATLTVAHGINEFTVFTNIYGTIIVNIPEFRPLPYVSATLITDQVGVSVTPINYVITNGATAPAITSGTLVLEYLKI